MEGGSIQPLGLGAGLGNSCPETRRGRIVSTRTCQISRSRGMACTACILRDHSPLKTQISLPPGSRTRRIRSVRDHILLGFSNLSQSLHPCPANGLQISIRTDHLHDLPHRGPTLHLRTSRATPITPTDHNLYRNTDRNNLPIPNNRIRTRQEVRSLGLDQSLPSRIVPRTLVET